MAFSPAFNTLNRSVTNLIATHPKTEYSSELGFAILTVPKRSPRAFRTQLSHGGERVIGEMNGIGQLGRISITGASDNPLTPVDGWHTFDLLEDGTVSMWEDGVAESDEQRRTLNEEQLVALAKWLDDNRDTLLAD